MFEDGHGLTGADIVAVVASVKVKQGGEASYHSAASAPGDCVVDEGTLRAALRGYRPASLQHLTGGGMFNRYQSERVNYFDSAFEFQQHVRWRFPE